jgi:hypothetical protein
MGDFFNFVPVGSDGMIGALPGSDLASFLSGGLPFVTSTNYYEYRNADGTTTLVAQENYIDGSADFVWVTFDQFDNYIWGAEDNISGGGIWEPGPDDYWGPMYQRLWISVDSSASLSGM